MRITVFGAAGSVGRRVVAEALSRDHEVTAVVRDPAKYPELRARAGDAANVQDVIELSAGQDLVITTTRPAPGRESELAQVAETVLKGVEKTGVRLLVVGGAAGLKVPGGGTVVDDPGLPEDVRAIALACNEQLAVCRANSTVDWAYASPPALLEPGERTGGYRLGADDLLVDAEGRSMISMEDFAVALLDEAERPKHHRTRFTVAY